MAQTNIFAILDDGSNPAPTTPPSTVQTLSLPQYATLRVRIAVFYPSGVAVPLAAVSTGVVLSVKKNSQDQVGFIVHPCVLAPLEGPNICYATIQAADTQYPPTGVGNYVYDVALTDINNDRSVIVSLSTFALLPAVGTPTLPITPPVPNPLVAFGLPTLPNTDGVVLTQHPVGTLAWLLPPNASAGDPKTAARVTTTGANITLSGLQTIDGISINDEDRVYVRNQSDPTQNGPYAAHAGPWLRVTDGAGDTLSYGLTTTIVEGATLAGSLWAITAADPITIGVTAITTERVGGSGSAITSLTGDVLGTGPGASTTTVSKIGGISVSADPLAQYALLAGRSGGQTLNGGPGISDTLTLQGNPASTLNTFVGGIIINSGVFVPFQPTTTNSWIVQTGTSTQTGFRGGGMLWLTGNGYSSAGDASSTSGRLTYSTGSGGNGDATHAASASATLTFETGNAGTDNGGGGASAGDIRFTVGASTNGVLGTIRLGDGTFGNVSPVSLSGSGQPTTVGGSLIVTQGSTFSALTASTVPYLDASKVLQSSAVTPTQLSYVDFTSSGQTQLNTKMSNALTSAHIYVGNGSNVATDVALSGAATIDNTGLMTLATVPVNKGGTGQTSYTNGQLLIGNTTGNTLAKATLTQGTGITITNGAGTISVAVNTGANLTWSGFETFSNGINANGGLSRSTSGSANVYSDTNISGLFIGSSNSNLTQVNLQSGSNMFISSGTTGTLSLATNGVTFFSADSSHGSLLAGSTASITPSTSLIAGSSGATTTIAGSTIAINPSTSLTAGSQFSPTVIKGSTLDIYSGAGDSFFSDASGNIGIGVNANGTSTTLLDKAIAIISTGGSPVKWSAFNTLTVASHTLLNLDGMDAGTAGAISFNFGTSPVMALTYAASTPSFGIFSQVSTPAVQQTGGPATAGAVYTATEQGMLNALYGMARAYGLIT